MHTIRYFTIHFTIFSSTPSYLSNRAAANMGQGRLAETVADCHQAISRDPGYSKAYLRRARALAVR